MTVTWRRSAGSVAPGAAGAAAAVAVPQAAQNLAASDTAAPQAAQAVVRRVPQCSQNRAWSAASCWQEGQRMGRQKARKDALIPVMMLLKRSCPGALSGHSVPQARVIHGLEPPPISFKKSVPRIWTG